MSGSKDEEIREKVRAGYASIAKQGVFTITDDAGCSCGGGGCCGSVEFDVEKLVKHIGYSEADLAVLPEGANMGLSCGNPTAIESLQPGEVVLDLGSGGGFDAFIAGAKVGPQGRVIGVDMTAEMIAKARKNIEAYTDRTGLDNVEFRLGEIEYLPVADASVDVVISNCVLNLSPHKQQVWREIARVLKAGGRAQISDLGLSKPLPDGVAADVQALVGCIAGAVLLSETEAMIKKAGLVEARLTTDSAYIEALMRSGEPLYKRIAAALPAGSCIADYVTSLSIVARKAPIAA